ncbi:MAG: MerR family transcriptional regulator [Marinobacterium sp.]|nr:MerR family transcriptional regulator [Marinobacterium sp.]
MNTPVRSWNSDRLDIEYPALPSRRYFTIGEAAKLCNLKPHVLRYWEQEFRQIRPVRRNNRRYYQHRDIYQLRQVQSLLHEQGYSIADARQWLSENKRPKKEPKKQVQQPVMTTVALTPKPKPKPEQLLQQTLTELEEVLNILKSI